MNRSILLGNDRVAIPWPEVIFQKRPINSILNMNLSRIIKTALVLGTLAFCTHSALAQDPFIGEIKIVPYNFAPRGWAFCDGQLLAIGQNQALFSLLGTTYGGDGRTTFALPDLRGRFPLGAGNGPGLTPVNLGEKSGRESYTLTVANLPAHTHPLLGNQTEASAISPSGNTLAAKARVPLYTSEAPNVPMNAQSVGATGGNAPYEVTPPYTSVNYIIALVGIYPSRS